MTKKKGKDISYEIGDILEVESFAGPKIYKRVTELVNNTTKYKSKHLGTITVKGFWGVLTRKKDLIALKRACVPHTGKEKLSKCRSFTYDWAILRVVKKAKGCSK
tara:strand:+ start:88 stop:402 length:315 start_codon:yes stop_codon:yes gene_type:complete